MLSPTKTLLAACACLLSIVAACADQDTTHVKLKARTVGNPLENPINAVAFSPDGRLLAAGAYHNQMTVYTVKSGEVLFDLTEKADERLKLCFDVRSVAFSPDGKRFAVGTDTRGTQLWDISRQEYIKSLPAKSSGGIAFSPDGKLLASASDRSLTIWDVDKAEKKSVSKVASTWVSKAIFSPDGQLVATNSEDGTVCLWDVKSGKLARTLRGHENSVDSLDFSPDGKVLATGSRADEILLWDTGTWKALHTLPGKYVAFSGDGKHVVCASQWRTAFEIRESATGKCRFVVEESRFQMHSLALCRKTHHLAIGDDRGRIFVWNLSKLLPLQNADQGKRPR